MVEDDEDDGGTGEEDDSITESEFADEDFNIDDLLYSDEELF